MEEHQIAIEHQRRVVVRSMDSDPPNSRVRIEAEGSDLVEACRELLSRLPNDVYAALKAAMGPQ